MLFRSPDRKKNESMKKTNERSQTNPHNSGTKPKLRSVHFGAVRGGSKSSREVVVLVAVVEVVVHGDGSCTHVRLGEVLDESNIFGATVVVHVVDELGDPKGYLAGRRGTRCRGTCRISRCSRTCT